MTSDGLNVLRVAIVDDHPIVRAGTTAAMAAEPDLDLVAVGENLLDARSLLARGDIDVVVLDVRLASDSGLAALGPRHVPPPAVVILTAYDLPQYAAAALRLGAAGFVLKTAPASELLAAIRRAAAGALSFGITPAQRLILSEREIQVVRLVVEGRTNDEIAASLGIRSKTVETHLRRVFERLGVMSRTELATRALREGWFDLPPAARAP